VKVGHFAKDCRYESKKETNFLSEDAKEEGKLMMSRRSSVELSPSCSDNSVSYLDTGASNHMYGDENFFKELSKVDAGHVSFGDASKVAVKGRGTIWYLQNNNRIGEIKDVYYVPSRATY